MEFNPETIGWVCRSNDEIVELDVLLPNSYAAALEAAAHSRGQTTGQVMRDLIRLYLHQRNRE